MGKSVPWAPSSNSTPGMEAAVFSVPRDQPANHGTMEHSAVTSIFKESVVGHHHDWDKQSHMEGLKQTNSKQKPKTRPNKQNIKKNGQTLCFTVLRNLQQGSVGVHAFQGARGEACL